MLFKKFCSIFLFFIACNQAVHAESAYVPGISDLPVPAGFVLVENSSSVFRSQAGRIIEASFQGSSTKPDIEEFYDLTLRALGWNRDEKLTYLREAEKLIITIHQKKIDNKNIMEIHFSISPN